MDESEIRMIRRNQCPTCGNWGFIAGPRGGAGQNVYCCNPECRAAFMVAPRHDIQLADRVGKAGEQYYAPKVHILAGGQALCGFAGWRTIAIGPPPRTLPLTPDEWPVGHSWTGREDFEAVTCKACRERGTRT